MYTIASDMQKKRQIRRICLSISTLSWSKQGHDDKHHPHYEQDHSPNSCKNRLRRVFEYLPPCSTSRWTSGSRHGTIPIKATGNWLAISKASILDNIINGPLLMTTISVIYILSSVLQKQCHRPSHQHLYWSWDTPVLEVHGEKLPSPCHTLWPPGRRLVFHPSIT